MLDLIKEQELLGKVFKVYGTFEEPLFLAKDVATWIEHSNVSKMLKSVDDEEKEKVDISALTNRYGGNINQEAWFLTEYGLYEVLMHSRKPIAKDFKKEVKKILKEIRTNGSYSIDEPEPQLQNKSADEVMTSLRSKGEDILKDIFPGFNLFEFLQQEERNKQNR